MLDSTSGARAAAARRALIAFLRRPAVIVSEVAAVGASAALAAALPQRPDAEELERFARDWPRAAAVAGALRLDEIVTSAWFLALVSLCLLSLAAVQAEQWPRLRRLWRAGLGPSTFARAPYRREVPLAECRAVPPAPRFASRGRLGHLGSPVFHLGILLIATAGLVRLLFFRDAVGRFAEGETIPASPAAFPAERGGWLSRPFALPRPVRIEAIRETRYPSGALLQLAARVSLLGAGAPEVRDLAVNAPADVDGVRLYLDADHGVAALLEHLGPAGSARRVAWLEPRGDDVRGRLVLDGGWDLRLRLGPEPRQRAVEIRVLREGTLLGVVEVAPGEDLPLGAGHTLRLAGLAGWARIRGSRDPSRPLFFAGAAVVILGVALLFGVTRVDEGIFVEGDRLVVALRPQRFAPLYAERFERMVREWAP